MERFLVCKNAKGRRKDIGLNQPLPISNRPLDSINMYFFLGLPQTERGNASIFFVVDRFSIMVQFIPCTKTTYAMRVSNLFFKEFMRL